MPKLSALIVAMHAIWQDGHWWGCHLTNRVPTYELHLRTAAEIAAREGYELLIPSGGWTRPGLPEVRSGQVTNSEATGAAAWWLENGIRVTAKVLPETFARDSFENLLYGALLAHHEARGRGSELGRVGVLSYDFKQMRFTASAVGLGLASRLHYYGVGGFHTIPPQDWPAVLASESASLGAMHSGGDLFDPLHRREECARKRAERTPPGVSEVMYRDRVAEAVGGDEEVRRLLQSLAELPPGPGWRDIVWPWSR